MRPLPIASLSGSPELHEAANKYNVKLTWLLALEDALAWNNRERHGSGFFLERDGQTRPPVPTANLDYGAAQMRRELEEERARIALESEGTVKP